MAFDVCYYPHNDLGNLAHYHLGIINQKVARSEREGITLDCMSFLIALAFSVEAMINFVGSEKIEAWKERDGADKKLNSVCKAIFDIAPDKETEPYATLEILKKIRDQMAHGKPKKFIDPAQSMSELRAAMASPWDKYLDPDFCNLAYGKITEFKKQLFETAGIGFGASLTSAIGGVQTYLPLNR